MIVRVKSTGGCQNPAFALDLEARARTEYDLRVMGRFNPGGAEGRLRVLS